MPLILLNIFKNLFNYPSILRIIIVIIMNEESETQSGKHTAGVWALACLKVELLYLLPPWAIHTCCIQ